MLSRLALIFLLVGCDESPPPAEPAPRTEAEALVDETIEHAEEELAEPPPSSWPTEVESLREAIERFETVDACLASLRARTPTEVAEGVVDLGYDAFFEDVCRSMAAVHDADPSACDGLSVSTAQRGCRSRLAIFHGDPSACPEDRSRPGRDPVCVAWAARDEGLCRSAAVGDRMRCRAVLASEAERCPRAREADGPRCRAEVERYADALGEERRVSAATRRPSVFELRFGETRLESDSLARGVRLVPRGCRHLVELGDARSGPAIGEREPSFSLALVIPAAHELPRTIPLGATDAVLEVVTEERGAVASHIGAQGHVELTVFEPTPGGAIEGTIEGELSHLTETIPVRARFASFVRDLDPLDEACQAANAP